MKLLSILLISAMLCVMASTVFADTTSTKWFHAHQYINEDSYVDRYDEFEKRKCNPLGIGVDLTVYEFDGVVNEYGLDAVEIQNKWDLRNNRYSGYLVIQMNPFRVIKDLLE